MENVENEMETGIRYWFIGLRVERKPNFTEVLLCSFCNDDYPHYSSSLLV